MSKLGHWRGSANHDFQMLSEVLDEPEGRDAAKWTTNLQNHEKALKKNSEKVLELKAKYDAQAGQAPGGVSQQAITVDKVEADNVWQDPFDKEYPQKQRLFQP